MTLLRRDWSGVDASGRGLHRLLGYLNGASAYVCDHHRLGVGTRDPFRFLVREIGTNGVGGGWTGDDDGVAMIGLYCGRDHGLGDFDPGH